MNEDKILVTHINIRQSIFFLILRLIVLDIIAVFFILVFFSSFSVPFVSDALKLKVIGYNMPFFLVLGLIKFFVTLFVVFQWLSTYYEIWPNSIIHKGGIIWKKEEKYPFGHIRLIKIEQGILGRLLTYGTLSLYDYSLRRYASLYLIHNPIKYFHILDGLVPKAEKEKEILRDHIGEREDG